MDYNNHNQYQPPQQQPPVYTHPQQPQQFAAYGAPASAPAAPPASFYPVLTPNQPTAEVHYPVQPHPQPQPQPPHVATVMPVAPMTVHVAHTPVISQNTSLVPVDTPLAIRCPNIDLRVQSQAVAAGSKVVVFSDNGSHQQKWIFTKDGFIELFADRSLVLDCKTGAPGEEIIVWHKKFTPDNITQKWIVTGAGSNRQICSALNPALVLDVRGGNMNKGTDLILWTNNGTQPANRHQHFNFYTYPNAVPPKPSSTTTASMTSTMMTTTTAYPAATAYYGAPAGYAYPVPVHTVVTSTSSSSSDSTTTINGVPVHSTSYSTSTGGGGGGGQPTATTHPLNSPTTIANATTNLVVEIALNHRVPGTAATMRGNTSAHHQQWVLTADGFIENRADRNLVLDCKSGVDGEDVICWTKKHGPDNANQRWIVTPVRGQAYRYISPACNPGLALTVFNASGVAGTKLVVAHNPGPAANNKHQMFYFKTVNN